MYFRIRIIDGVFYFCLAPEVLNPCQYSFPADIFAFSIVSWETITVGVFESNVFENPFNVGDSATTYSKVPNFVYYSNTYYGSLDFNFRFVKAFDQSFLIMETLKYLRTSKCALSAPGAQIQ